jgi:hypothetical protein
VHSPQCQQFPEPTAKVHVSTFFAGTPRQAAISRFLHHRTNTAPNARAMQQHVHCRTDANRKQHNEDALDRQM